MWYFLTYYFQGVLGYGPVKAGFAFLPDGPRHHHRRPDSLRDSSRRRASGRCCRSVPCSATLGFLWISLIKPADSYAGHILVPSFICAFAMGLLFAPLATAATVGRRPRRRRPGLGHSQHRAPSRRLPVARRSSPPWRPTCTNHALVTAVASLGLHVRLRPRLPDLGLRDRRRVRRVLRAARATPVVPSSLRDPGARTSTPQIPVEPV